MTTACANKIDRFTIDKVLDRATDHPDVDMVCGLGRSLTHPLGALPAHEPERSMVVSEGVAGLCAQLDAWEAELDEVRAKENLSALGAARAAEVIDAGLRRERANALAAARFERSWQHLLRAWPSGDGSCPRVKEKDEFVYMFGNFMGMLALLHDRSGGGLQGIPLDRPLEVARASTCLEEGSWWGALDALEAAAWATIPGSGPEGVDPWERLEQVAVEGEATGVRVARAVQVLIAANAGRQEIVEGGIRAFAEASPDLEGDWLLLDAYGQLVVQHQSDLVWIRERGHRTEVLGVLPSDGGADSPSSDPFGAVDPFGATDPFGTPDDEETETPPEEEETP
ncbi:MAG TPA: hypothetical protein ENK18_02315 [Deltaproteobacteria bacterium]|nr:hypothetical protein [Deltaproteobacteria bacterium]